MEIDVTDREDSRCFGTEHVDAASRPRRRLDHDGEVHGRRREGRLPHLNFTFPSGTRIMDRSQRGGQLLLLRLAAFDFNATLWQ